MKKSTIFIIIIATIISSVIQMNILPRPYANYSMDEKTGIIPQSAETINQVVFEQDGIKITALAFGPFRAGSRFVYLYFLVENDTEDVGANVVLEYTSLNGIMTNSRFHASVVPGEKEQDRASIDCPTTFSSFANAGITEVYEYKFCLSISYSGARDDRITTDPITISFTDEEWVQEYDVEGKVIIEQDGFRFIERGFMWYGRSLVLSIYAENMSQYDARIYNKDVYVNGNKLGPSSPVGSSGTDAGTYWELPAESRIYRYISFWYEDKVPYDIPVIEEVELNFEITDKNTSGRDSVIICHAPPSILTFDFPTERPSGRQEEDNTAPETSDAE